jgi:hypothetical protein
MKRGRRQAQKQVPAWLIGLILGAVLFAILLFVLESLGYGDDPSSGAVFLTPASGSERWGEYRRRRGGGSRSTDDG